MKDDFLLGLKLGFMTAVILCFLISPLIVGIVSAAVIIGHHMMVSKGKINEDTN